jgi:hypothetical protein
MQGSATANAAAAAAHAAAPQAPPQPPQAGDVTAEGAQDRAEGAPTPAAAADDGGPGVREAAGQQQQQLADEQSSSQQQQQQQYQSPTAALSGLADTGSSSGAARYWWLGFMAGGVLMAVSIQVVHAVRSIVSSSKGYLQVSKSEGATAAATELTPLAAQVHSSDTVESV